MAITIGGKVVDGPKQVIIALPRGDQGDIGFIFIAVLDDSEFEKLCPVPKPPVSIKTGVGRIENVEDPGYRAAVERRGSFKADWFFLNSIRPSQIEWQTVKMNDMHTWENWRKELRDSGFSVAECNRLWETFLDVNTVSDQMVQEARLRFLVSQAADSLAKLQPQISEHQNTESGELASVGESAPPE